MSNKLDDIRKGLDAADKKIINALAKRQELVREVSSLKLDGDKKIRDTDREEQLLSKITELARQAGLDRYFAEQLFKDIIQHSVRFQQHELIDHQNEAKDPDIVQVAYQGTDGAFSHQAAYRHFEERYAEVHCFGYQTFRQAAEAVAENEVDYAILPIENTTAGSINDTYDLLGDGDLHIVGEEAIRVIHCLLAIDDVPVDRIRRIMSHPQAIAQCSNYLAKLHNCNIESYIDTAMSAKKVLEDGDLSQAAIAGSYAADIYDLEILERDLANQSQNFTRFVVVGRQPVEVDSQIPCKTSLLMATSHDKGALIKCLNVIDDHDIRMTKLESRPKPNEPWKYQFYLDVEGNISNSDTRVAIEELEQEAESLKVLGSYPAHVGNEE